MRRKAKSAGRRSRRKKIYDKCNGKFTPYQLRQIAKAGLPPPAPQLTTKEFAKLQQQWYAKAAEAGLTDIEWVDHATGRGQDSPHLKGSLALGKTYHVGRETYYQMATTYLHHCKALRGYRRFIWKLHSEAVPYEQILQQVKLNYTHPPSIYTLYYDIKKLAELCYAWNRTHPEGLLVKRAEDRDRFNDSYLAEIFATEYHYILGEEPL